MRELEWKQMAHRHQGNIIWQAWDEEGYYAKYNYTDLATCNIVTHTVGPCARKLTAVNAIRKHIDNRVIQLYGPKENDR